VFSEKGSSSCDRPTGRNKNICSSFGFVFIGNETWNYSVTYESGWEDTYANLKEVYRCPL
jgi:hypothetical protein